MNPESKDQFLMRLKAEYQELGVILSIKRSNDKQVTLKCDRGGHYSTKYSNSVEQRKRQSHTRLTGCPFELVCSSRKGIWAVRNVPELHNHEISENVVGHSIARKPSDAEKATIISLGESGLAPKHILSVLKHDFPNSKVVAQNVYNELHHQRFKSLNGRTSIEALIDSISTPEFERNVRMVNGRVNAVFFAHKYCMVMAKRFNTVFLMDCTYKTNKYGMPLLNIVGITSTYKSFNAAFAFISTEDQESYEWALKQFSYIVHPKVISTDREMALIKAIERVFPHARNVLCIWHINKNILANCKKHFDRDEDWEKFLRGWNGLVWAKSEDDFYNALEELKSQFRNYAAVFDYIEVYWVPFKAYFAQYSVNEFPHFGTVSTSRVEGNHHVLKSYIQLGKMDLLVVYKRINLLLANQKLELIKSIESEKLIVSHRHKIDCFQKLFNKVSQFALDKILEQYKLAYNGESIESCSGKFTKTFGLPCKHQIREYAENRRQITLEMLHDQWRLDIGLSETGTQSQPSVSDESPRKRLLKKMEEQLYRGESNLGSMMSRLEQVIETPFATVKGPDVVSKKRGRPAGAKNKSIGRDKSAFEYVQGRKCGNCGELGHDKRTCKGSGANK